MMIILHFRTRGRRTQKSKDDGKSIARHVHTSLAQRAPSYGIQRTGSVVAYLLEFELHLEEQKHAKNREVMIIHCTVG